VGTDRSTLDTEALGGETATEVTGLTEDRQDYWDGYYAAHRPVSRPLPSQFASFVAGELEEPHRVVELGCGNGRDAIFFAGYGHEVVGVDASEAAVSGCRDLAAALGAPAEFTRSHIEDPGLAERLGPSARPTLVYARFFLHAITDDEEERLLDLAASITRPGDLLAVEYRTVRDSTGPKVTGSHFRRYVLPAEFETRALAHGFTVAYAVEGFGFAKYRTDDAYVARGLYRRHEP